MINCKKDDMQVIKMTNKKLGDRIRDLRETNNIKQKDLAANFGVENSTWSQYETNKRIPDLDTIRKLSEYFNVSVDYLFSITDIKYSPYDPDFKKLMVYYSGLNEKSKVDLFSTLKIPVK